MSGYSVTSFAKADLRRIFQYIAKDNVPAAQRLVEQLHDRFALLASNPQMGELRSGLGDGVRSISVGNYVIFVRQGSRSLQIARVIHGARDVEAVFREERQ